ncbi:hypothetical protein ACFL0D_06095, partial [Thermoproteota archaeon]
ICGITWEQISFMKDNEGNNLNNKTIEKKLDFSDDVLIILEIIKNKKMSSKEAYFVYSHESHEPMDFNSFKKILNDLSNRGVIKSYGVKRWKRYEYNKLDFNENDEYKRKMPDWSKIIMKLITENKDNKS